MDDRVLFNPSPAIAGSDQPSPLTAEQVYLEFRPRVFHVARRMVSNEADAEDVTQDVFTQVVRKLPTFRGDAALPTWLHRVTVNHVLMRFRKKSTRSEMTTSDGELPEPVTYETIRSATTSPMIIDRIALADAIEILVIA